MWYPSIHLIPPFLFDPNIAWPCTYLNFLTDSHYGLRFDQSMLVLMLLLMLMALQMLLVLLLQCVGLA